jgi:hypothetical protein
LGETIISVEKKMYLKKSEIKVLCTELLDDFEPALSWKWDSGFNSLVAEFSANRQEEIGSVLERHLNFRWDSNSIRKAPERVKSKSGDLGDLRDNQLLFTTDPEGDPLVFAAWWPWGNGEVVSVRLASPATGERTEETGGVFSMIKRLFG